MIDAAQKNKVKQRSIKIGNKMKQRAWGRGEVFCPCCGVRMWFPQFQPKIKKNKDPEGRKQQVKAMVTLDHWKRVADGGDNQDTNLRLICQECNSGRHDHEGKARQIRVPENIATHPSTGDGWSETSGVSTLFDPKPAYDGPTSRHWEALVPPRPL